MCGALLPCIVPRHSSAHSAAAKSGMDWYGATTTCFDTLQPADLEGRRPTVVDDVPLLPSTPSPVQPAVIAFGATEQHPACAAPAGWLGARAGATHFTRCTSRQCECREVGQRYWRCLIVLRLILDTGSLGAVFRTVLETTRTLFVWLVGAAPPHTIQNQLVAGSRRCFQQHTLMRALPVSAM